MTRPKEKIGAVAPWNKAVNYAAGRHRKPEGEPVAVAEAFDVLADVVEFFIDAQATVGPNGSKTWALASMSPFHELQQMAHNAIPNVREGITEAVRTGAMDEAAAAQLAANIVSLADLSVRVGAHIDWKHWKDARKAPQKKGGDESGKNRRSRMKTWQERAEEKALELLEERKRPMTQIAPLVHKAIRPPVSEATVLEHLQPWNTARKKKSGRTS